MSNISLFWSQVKAFAVAHKLWSAIIVVVLLGGGWLFYGKLHGSSTTPQYVLTTVQTGTM